MKPPLLAILLFFSLTVFSQGEANIWYFGENAGLDFNSGSPVVLTNGKINTMEGCAVLSNSSGQLLFYTDGITIYNKNHQIMVNGDGLTGHQSTSQSATILQMPGNSKLYYVFTLDAAGFINGLRYSIVDISLDGGNGAVTSEKNILIYTPSNEKLAVVKHDNNKDYWIVTHSLDGNTFYAHLLSEIGINPIPIITNIGFNLPGGNYNNPIGCSKLSPNGKKIAVVHTIYNTAQLFDFNNVTGEITNGITLIDNSSQGQSAHLYGVEFSPNSEVLYVGHIYSGGISQFDLTSVDIPNSKVDLSFSINEETHSLQLGPDKKIYIAHYFSNKLSVINSPNTLGLGCNLQMKVISLGSKFSTIGLPSFCQSVFYKPPSQSNDSNDEDDEEAFPNFFTPNGDGYNDYWNIKGESSIFNAESIISIFDRYGKLLKQISPSGIGWDGKYNGKDLPSTDYWFSVEYTTQSNNKAVFKSHFTLKR